MKEPVASPNSCARFPDLEGKCAIVSGASQGIGAGIAEFLARQGMRVILTARSEDKGKAIVASLTQEGLTCAWVTADVSETEGARRVLDEAVRLYDRVDLLVNNAADIRSVPFLKLKEAEYHQSFERNVRLVYELSFLTAHHMTDESGGAIIHISSVGGLRSHRGLAGYDASKGAINALTRSMALDLAPHRIRVNAVAPGNTRGCTLHPHPGIPLGRSGSPMDVGAAVAFLASDAAAYITGQVLYVDGGLTAQLTPPGIFI